MTFFRNADCVRVVSSSSGSEQIQATKYISYMFEANLFINGDIKSVTLLEHAVFACVNSSSRPSTIKNSTVVDKLHSALLSHHSELTMTAIKTGDAV